MFWNIKPSLFCSRISNLYSLFLEYQTFTLMIWNIKPLLIYFGIYNLYSPVLEYPTFTRLIWNLQPLLSWSGISNLYSTGLEYQTFTLLFYTFNYQREICLLISVTLQFTNRKPLLVMVICCYLILHY